MEEQEQILKEDRLVVEALRKAGVFVSSSQDLVTTRDRYPKAIPVLLEMLAKVETLTIKGIIVRALGVKEAKGHAEPFLISEFETSLQDPSDVADDFRWKIANTLEILGGGKGASEALLRFLTDPRSGRARGMLSVAVAKAKNRDAIPILIDMLDRNEFTGFAAEALGILRAEEASPRLESIANSHEKPWVRRQASNALKRIRKPN